MKNFKLFYHEIYQTFKRRYLRLRLALNNELITINYK